MDKSFIYVLFLLVTLNGHSQGTLEFKNRHISAGVDAPVFLSHPSELLDSRFVAQLWAGPTADELAPVTEPVPFREGAGVGYWNPGIENPAFVNSVIPDVVAFVDVFVWDANYATFFDALSAGALANSWTSWSQNTPLEIVAGGSGDPPSHESPLVGLTPFGLVVPEPSIFSLALVGLLGGGILRKIKSDSITPDG